MRTNPVNKHSMISYSVVTRTVHVILYLSNAIEYHIMHVLQTKISLVIFSASQRFSIEAHSIIDAL